MDTLKRIPARTWAAWGLAVLAALGMFLFTRNLISCWQLTALPGIPPAECAGSSTPAAGIEPLALGTPALVPSQQADVPAVLPPQWDGASRINIVFLGLRGGDPAIEADCPLCTDTIIVFTLDPVTKTAGMINVPRDLYVNIPGYGFSRINVAWTEGEREKLPGGGPGLAMKTVSQFLGVPIQYYAQVDFDTFVQFIDMIHGVDVYNDENLMLQKLGGGRDGIRITCCGVRHLGGQAALAYARCRDPKQGCTDGDIGRARRQQKIILSVRQKVFSPEYFPTLIGQAPQLYQLFSAGIRTNLSLEDAIKLAYLMNDIPPEHIQQGLIDDTMVVYGRVNFDTGPAASILMPVPDKIRELRDQLFAPGAMRRPMASGEAQALMQSDAARVRIVNESGVADLETRTANYLAAQGMTVVEQKAAPASSRPTTVVVFAPKVYALRYLIKPLGIILSSSQVMLRPDPAAGVDLEIHLGKDWSARIPSGY